MTYQAESHGILKMWMTEEDKRRIYSWAKKRLQQWKLAWLNLGSCGQLA